MDRHRREAEEDDDDSDIEILDVIRVDENIPRAWPKGVGGRKRNTAGKDKPAGKAEGAVKDDTVGKDEDASQDPAAIARYMHADDFSSDDEDDEGTGNRIGRVPLHWYDDYDHVGYDAHGEKVIKSKTSSVAKDALDRAIDQSDADPKKHVVYDALNAKDVELTPRQVELIRRVQGGAFAHPEHEAHPDYVDYFSGVDPELSGLNSGRQEAKHRFQPSKWEKLQVRRLLHRLKCGSINQDFLEGKVRDMNDLIKNPKRLPGEGGKSGEDTDDPFALWRGDEEDELNLRKGPQHAPAPKLPPPGHALSYNPPEEYLPNEQELEEWKEMDPSDRPYGDFVPKKFPNLRSVGAYEHAVKERFERCLDLYLCPRALKRRLNIDPESLVPKLPKASDLRPFPTTKCVAYDVPTGSDNDDEDTVAAAIRCLSVSPDGQFLASGAEDGYVRLWEVQTGRMLRSWNISALVQEEEENDDDDKKTKPAPVVSVEFNPDRAHHCLIVAAGKCAVIIATGTAGPNDAEVTDALLSSASSLGSGGGNIRADSRAAKAVKWSSLEGDKGGRTVSAFGGVSGPICILRANSGMAMVRWHRKGDYFVTVCPKAGAAAVLIHQLCKASSQQPFGKAKGEAQAACFHPVKPFLFVASTTDVRVYHLVKQSMVKRLLSGCRHISSIDVHPSGDHVVVGSLDRRLVWFDLDLSSTPYKTLKYHERALRSVGFHRRYPLMASSSDDGSIHVFHSMVYSDLMRNPLIVPVKVLRGHTVVKSLGTLAMVWHPTQPWLFSAGADGKIHLFQDL